MFPGTGTLWPAQGPHHGNSSQVQRWEAMSASYGEVQVDQSRTSLPARKSLGVPSCHLLHRTKDCGFVKEMLDKTTYNSACPEKETRV